MNPELRSAAAEFAAAIAKPEIFSDFGRAGVPRPELIEESRREATVQSTFALLLSAIDGKDEATKAANLETLYTIVRKDGGDLIEMVGYLVYPNQQEPREQLVEAMTDLIDDKRFEEARLRNNSAFETFTMLSYGHLNLREVIDYSLFEMKKKERESLEGSIKIRDTEGKVITDSQGQQLEFFLEEHEGESFLVLGREVVPVADSEPGLNYSFSTLAEFQKALNEMIRHYSPPENNLHILLRSGDLIVTLDKVIAWNFSMPSTKSSTDLTEKLSMYPEGVVQPTNWKELFERFGWEEPSPPGETPVDNEGAEVFFRENTVPLHKEKMPYILDLPIVEPDGGIVGHSFDSFADLQNALALAIEKLENDHPGESYGLVLESRPFHSVLEREDIRLLTQAASAQEFITMILLKERQINDKADQTEQKNRFINGYNHWKERFEHLGWTESQFEDVNTVWERYEQPKVNAAKRTEEEKLEEAKKPKSDDDIILF